MSAGRATRVDYNAPENQLEQIVLDGAPKLETRVVNLGPLRFVLRTNVLNFSGLSYFCRVSSSAAEGDASVSRERYQLTLIDLDHLHRFDERMLRQLGDTSYRASRFSAGFYLSAHFGEPATLATRDDRCYVFGRRLDRILWGWYVKYLLTAHSIESGTLHLKAGCVAVEDKGALLIGRCGGGKTVFLMQMCLNGAAFISNTHTLVDAGHEAHGVASTLRVRSDPALGSLLGTTTLHRHLAADTGDRILDPTTIGIQHGERAKIRAICVLDYRPYGTPTIERMSTDDAYDFAEQFALAINAYGMKDDVLEQMCNGNTMQFARAHADMKRRLKDLVSSSRCYRISSDVTDASQRLEIWRLLSSA